MLAVESCESNRVFPRLTSVCYVCQDSGSMGSHQLRRSHTTVFGVRTMMMDFFIPLLLVLNFLPSTSHALVLNQTPFLGKPMTRLNTAAIPRCDMRCRSTRQMMLLDPNDIFESMVSQSTSFLTSVDLGAAGEESVVTYSKASYYTILALYLISLPGLWSTIQRTTKVKMQLKTYVSPGEQSPGGKSLRQEAGEIMACKLAQALFPHWTKNAVTVCHTLQSLM